MRRALLVNTENELVKVQLELKLICTAARDVFCELTYLYAEVAFFEYPLAIVANKCKIRSLKLEANCACFARHKLHFLKTAKAAPIGNHACNKIA